MCTTTAAGKAFVALFRRDEEAVTVRLQDGAVRRVPARRVRLLACTLPDVDAEIAGRACRPVEVTALLDEGSLTLVGTPRWG